LGMWWMQLTETGTNAFTSSGEWMKQVNRAIAHALEAVQARKSICPISF